MKNRYADDTLWVRTPRGEMKLLFAFGERRTATAKADDDIRWARDDEGHWYSFSRFGDAVVESLTGTWFAIVGKPAK